MTCEICGEREATVHLTETIDDETRELHLCQACAQEKGAAAAENFGLADLLAGLADFGVKPEVEGRSPAGQAVCARCGMRYEDFRKSGRLGCGGCYESFQRFLSPLLKKIHGATHHVGQAPPEKKRTKPVAPKEELEQLRERLKGAVTGEAFEEAARLRDRIRAVEAKKKR